MQHWDCAKYHRFGFDTMLSISLLINAEAVLRINKVNESKKKRGIASLTCITVAYSVSYYGIPRADQSI